MEFEIIKATKSKNYLKQEIWTPENITSKVVMPILDVSRLDRALDTSSLSYIDNKPTAVKPFSKIIIRTGNENIYRYVLHDNVNLIKYGTNREYKHSLDLIEPTKALERFVIDNTTITNLLAFLYDDIPFIDPTPARLFKTDTVSVPSWGGKPYSTEEYKNDNRYLARYILNQTVNLGILDVTANWVDPLDHFKPKSAPMGKPIERTITTPNGEVINATDLLTYQLNELGSYKIQEKYYISISTGQPIITVVSLTTEYTWYFNSLKEFEPQVNSPTRYKINTVIEEILDKVSTETTAPRLGLDLPLFHLDTSVSNLLKDKDSPEFTFTQNTLFGVLEEIGNYIHGIPRLIPTNNNGDDWSKWDTITYDFLGKQDKIYTFGDETGINPIEDAYTIVNTEQSYNGDNYATSFVTNVQNSFQTNKQDYISLVEPYDGGYISTRTEDANFEISNDHAVIKTSRPIQRIVALEVGVNLKTFGGEYEFFNIDITQRAKEHTDYNLLRDYAELDTDILETKSSAIYYTRGSNIIDGLAYFPPKELNIEYLSENRAIQNIISIMGRTTESIKLQNLSYIEAGKIKLKDLMFRIKYIPYYNFKAMQYKQSVDENSGNNTLFYNQQNAQQVDIESLGENVRGALMMTANKEFSLTGYSSGSNDMHTGDVLNTKGTYGNESNFYAYQINREFINKNTIKTTITFSKNFNKWNDYIAIRKNYREWEISNRESLETNPICNQFCIISDHSDFENLSYYETEQLVAMLNDSDGFVNGRVIYAIQNSLGKNNAIIKPLRWAYIKTKGYNEVTKENEVRKFFLPCACFGYGNSLILNWATQDNYSAGTKAEKSKDSTPLLPSGYAIENYVKYSNTLGKIDTMEVAYGNKELKINGFDTPINALKSSKEFYALDDATQINEDNINIDFRGEHPFIIKKDSRQQLNFTAQLNFLTDNNNIWISPELVNNMPYVGATPREYGVRWVYFRKSPDIFLNEINVDDIISDTYFNWQVLAQDTNHTAEIKAGKQSPEDFVGVGLVECNNDSLTIDKNSKILIYYKKDEKYKGSIYIKLRSRI